MPDAVQVLRCEAEARQRRPSLPDEEPVGARLQGLHAVQVFTRWRCGTMTPDKLKQAGKEAFITGAPATDCPYTFDKSDFWDRKDYNGFQTVRWKLDAWMAGWIEARKNAK